MSRNLVLLPVFQVARYTASRPENKATLDELEGTFLEVLERAKPTAEVRHQMSNTQRPTGVVFVSLRSSGSNTAFFDVQPPASISPTSDVDIDLLLVNVFIG